VLFAAARARRAGPAARQKRAPRRGALLAATAPHWQRAERAVEAGAGTVRLGSRPISAGNTFGSEKNIPPQSLARESVPPSRNEERAEKEVTEMVSAITSTAAAQPVASTTPADQKSGEAPPSKKQSSGGADADTVHLSSTAQAQLSAIQAVLQEATETPAQTSKEALSGDRQAKQLLAREAQTAKAAKLGQ